MRVNQVLLVGHLGKDPTIKQTQQSQVANFSIATTTGKKNRDGTWENVTHWHNIVAWGWLSEIVAEQFRKGDMVVVKGRIENRTWESPEGTKYITEVIAEDLVKCVGPPKYHENWRKGDKSDKAPFTKVYPPPPPEDDVPF